MIEGGRQWWYIYPFGCRGDDGRGGIGAYHLWSWPWVDAGRESICISFMFMGLQVVSLTETCRATPTAEG